MRYMRWIADAARRLFGAPRDPGVAVVGKEALDAINAGSGTVSQVVPYDFSFPPVEDGPYSVRRFLNGTYRVHGIVTSTSDERVRDPWEVEFRYLEPGVVEVYYLKVGGRTMRDVRAQTVDRVDF